MKKFSALVVLLACGACTPADRAAVAPYVQPAERLTCVALKALTTDGTVDQVCATADELAPLVPGLLVARSEARKVSAPSAEPIVSAELPMSSRVVERRRCVAWAPIPSSKDAGAE